MKLLLTIVLLCVTFLTAFAQQLQGESWDESCSNKLVSYADWPKIQSPNFLLDFAAPKGRLYYFGAAHSSEPANPQFAEIEKAWGVVKPTLAFFEGPNRPIFPDRDETIKQTGESGFVRYLATRDGVPYRSLEPSPQEEAAHILKRYSAEQVMLFYVLREAVRLRDRRKLSEDELKKAVAQLLAQASKMKGFEKVIPDLETLAAVYRKHWTSPADWWQAPAQWFEPGRTSAETGGRFTNEINRLSSEYRDLHMYRVLAQTTLEGNRVFAVVGRNHVPMQDQALRCALKQAP